MRLPAYLATLIFASVLTACGGGGDPVASGDSGSGDDSSDNSGTDDVTTSSNVDTPSIGTGTGSAYQNGVLSISAANLSAGGSTQITATIVDTGNDNKKIASEEYTVLFNSTCAADGRAEFSKDGQVTTSSGDVTVTYTAKGCSGDDFVTFGLYPSGATDVGERLAVASGTITVASPEVGAITFVSVQNPLISIATIGDAVLPKLTTVTFKVLDKTNNPIANKEVEFELSNPPAGGLELSIQRSVTNDQGEVSTVVLAGTTHTVTSVRATTIGTDGATEIYTSSQSISVTTGIADQDSFVIALDKYSTWGWDTFGEPSEIVVTAYVNDHFQNPVPDGTVVNFVADAGHIESACQTENGGCSVTWYSTEPLPGADESGNVFTADNSRDRASNVTYDATWNGGLPGVATIVAYTSGEAGFSDSDANNLFDDGESFESYAEAFLDANENGIYDHDVNTNPREQFFDFNSDGSFTSAPSTYQGISCADRNGVHCQSLMHVRDAKSFIVASASVSNALVSAVAESPAGLRDVTADSCVVMQPDEVVSYTYSISDVNGNTPPAGTSFDMDAGDLELIGSSVSEVATNIGTTSGQQVSFYVRGDPGSPVESIQRPYLIVDRVDGIKTTFIGGPYLTNNSQVVVVPNDRLARPGDPAILAFSDACGAALQSSVEVVAELANGNFDSASSGTVVKEFVVNAGDTLSIDVYTDGTSSNDAEGLTLTVFPTGNVAPSELIIGVKD